MTAATLGLLDVLLRERQPLTAAALARRMNSTPGVAGPGAVAAAMAELRELGCAFDEHPHRGVRLLEAGLATWADVLGRDRPRRVAVYRSTASTQDVACAWPDAGEGDLVVADAQSAGRGRLGRSWHAPPGSALLLTYVARRIDADHDRLLAALTVALAVAIERATGLAAETVRIKWPNDLMIHGGKLAGLLIERTSRSTLIGLGINVHARPAAVEQATCLAEHGLAMPRLALLRTVLDALDRTCRQPDCDADAWRRRCLTLTGPVRLQCDGRIVEGDVVDADPAMGLVVRTTAGALVHLPAATTGRLP